MIRQHDNLGGFRGQRFGEPRRMFKSSCPACGKDTEVPFRPNTLRPVYCRECFRKVLAERRSQHGGLLSSVPNFEFAGIADPDGRPYGPETEVPSAIRLSVCEINDEVIAYLRADPRRLRELPSRKFEQLVAELLARRGYEITLTPRTRDGGFDMYAARNEYLGRFLYLIECKRYSPPNKVGIAVVRSLYGVVQEKRVSAGIIATTSFFSSDAIAFQDTIKHQLQLQDYISLQRWLAST